MISFTVYGHPHPQGSMRAFFNQKTQRMQKFDSNKNLKPWRQELSRTALEANRGNALIEREVPVCVRLDFYLARPASLPKRFERPTKKPDLDKLTRSVCDALPGTIITDDSQIVELLVGKWFGLPERVEIFIELAQRDMPLLVGNLQFQEMGPRA